MKILRLTGSQPQPWAVDLHPRLTVVHGLAPEVAGPVRAAIDALVRARLSPPELAASGLGGLVAVGDREVSIEDVAAWQPGLVPAAPLRGADLRDGVLALAQGRARALDAEVAAAEAEVADAEAALAALRRSEAAPSDGGRTSAAWREREVAAAALRRARRRVADAVGAAADAEAARTPATGPSAEVGHLLAERERLATERVASARAARDAAAAAYAEADAERARLAGATHAELEALRAELADVERRCVELAPAPTAAAYDRRALVDRRAFLESEIEALSNQRADQVAQALAAAEAHRGIAVVEAARVAVEWERVRDLVAEAAAAPPPPPPVPPVTAAPAEMSELAASRLARANEEVTKARRAVAEASGASPLDPTDVEALEAAHAEVLSAWEGSERRIGVGKARRRLEDAQLAEREILARMGFASYTEFMVSGRASGSPSQLDAEEARRALRDAEARLAQVEAQVEEELNTARAAAAPAPDPAAGWDAEAAQGRLTATLAALRARAVDLLGEDPGDDVAGALRDRISTDPLPDLRLALDEVGVPLGEVLSREAVLQRAHDWLARAEADASRRVGLEAARAEIDAQLHALDAAEDDRRAWEALVARRDALREQVDASALATDAVEAADERLAHDRAEVARAEVALAEAEEDARRIIAGAGTGAAAPAADPVAPAADLAALEGEARDAQTALDVALSHLLSPRAAGDDPADAIGRAEARLVLAHLERDSLRSIRAARSGSEPAAPDVDDLVWRVLSVLASHQAAAVEGGPGPAPLVLDEPFGDLSPAEVASLCVALVGPARAVQVLVVTDRSDVAEWARAADPEAVGLAVPSLAGSSL